jgi:N-acetylglucosaminyldiphosphoundecaprenol N-acetyl-beta-D-mannosaminyltransferase
LAPSPHPGDRVQLLGLPVHVHDLTTLLDSVEAMITSGGRYTVCYANVHTLNQALELPDVAEFMRQADLVYCDGQGVRLGAALLGQRLPPRMTGADWIWDLARRAAAADLGVFWLGSAEGIAAAAADELRAAVPGLRIVGTHHGYFDKEGPGSDAVVEAINRARPDVLLVGLGTPLQERWVAANRDAIDASVVWVLGATAEFISGRVSRGPAILYDHGLEWLARLLVDPRRLWQRYLVGNTQFAYRVLRERARREP